MPNVRLKENEYFDAAMRRFKRACEKAGILTELRRREFYEKPTLKENQRIYITLYLFFLEFQGTCKKCH